MKWLFWREYRFNRLILIVGSLLLLLPYAIALIMLGIWWMRGSPDLGRHGVVAITFYAAAIYSLVFSQVTMACVGGNAIAGERADRSAEFLAYLPLSRPLRLVNKLSLALVTAVLLWGVNLSIMLISATMMPQLWPAPDDGFLRAMGYIAITGLTFFGVGWLISSLQSSPTFAVCGGLITPAIVIAGLTAPAWFGDEPDFSPFLGIGYTIICSVLAVVCFTIGTWYYLRRVEP